MYSFRLSICEAPSMPVARRFWISGFVHAEEMSLSRDAHAEKESPVLSVSLLIVSMFFVISWIAKLFSGPQTGAVAVVTITSRNRLQLWARQDSDKVVYLTILLCPASLVSVGYVLGLYLLLGVTGIH